MIKGTCIWADGGGIAYPLTPETLAAMAGGWAKDIRSLAPWTEVPEYFSVLDRTCAVYKTATLGPNILVCGRTSSTMDVAAKLAAQGLLAPWSAVIAPEQSAPRGQLRRQWKSTPGNLHVTWVWPKPPNKDWDRMAPLAAGWALCQGLEEMGLHTLIKWPNDLVQNGRKIGGLLLEDRGHTILAGCGFNLEWAPGDEAMRPDHAMPAGVARWSGKAPGPLGLWRKLVIFAENCYETMLSRHTPQDFAHQMTSRLAFLGQEVKVAQAEKSIITATIRGLAPDGGLIVSGSGGEETIHTGSIIPA